MIWRSYRADDVYFCPMGYDAMWIGIRWHLKAECCPILWSKSVKTSVANPPPQNVGILRHWKRVIFNKVGRDTSVVIVTRYGDRSKVGSIFSTPVQNGPGAHAASHTMGTGSFPRVNRPELCVDHPPTCSAEAKERMELYLYSPLCLHELFRSELHFKWTLQASYYHAAFCCRWAVEFDWLLPLVPTQSTRQFERYRQPSRRGLWVHAY